jgi:hypothetical protein
MRILQSVNYVTSLDAVRNAYAGEKLYLKTLSISRWEIWVNHTPDAGFLKQLFVLDYMEGDVIRELTRI